MVDRLKSTPVTPTDDELVIVTLLTDAEGYRVLVNIVDAADEDVTNVVAAIARQLVMYVGNVAFTNEVPIFCAIKVQL